MYVSRVHDGIFSSLEKRHPFMISYLEDKMWEACLCKNFKESMSRESKVGRRYARAFNLNARGIGWYCTYFGVAIDRLYESFYDETKIWKRYVLLRKQWPHASDGGRPTLCESA